MINNIIKLENVSKIYSTGSVSVEAVKDINLEIKKGDFLVIIGPSGSGKSTMMNMIGSLDIPTSGKIFLDNEDIARMDESELAVLRGKKIGFVFQTFNLLPTLSALDNVALANMFQGNDRETSRKLAKIILEKVGLGLRIKHKPSELSGGEKQRVAIARALINNPEVILADEPTGNLDTKTGNEIINMLKQLNKEGKTVIIITHNDKIAKEAKKVIKIRDGGIIK
jgi:putative ABC transport system ATP-binding protein